MFKVLASEVACNTTPSHFSNQRVIRLANKGTAARTVNLFDNPQAVSLTINASANATTLLTLTPGSTTTGLTTGMKIVGSSNVQVINSVVNSEIASIVNSTAITSNVDIIIANGVVQIYATTGKSFTMIPNSEFVIEKGRIDYLQSNNDTDIVGLAVTYRG